MAELFIGAAFGFAVGFVIARKFPNFMKGSKSGTPGGGGGGAQPQ